MRLIFVCTGNTCRSAMAEGIGRAVAEERGLRDVDVTSAGTAATEGAAASPGALLVALERGQDLSGHRARLLTRELVAGADLLLVMAPNHLDRIEALGGKGKAHLLTAFASDSRIDRPIADPFGGAVELYRETFDELDREIRRVFDRLAPDRAHRQS